MGDADGPPSGGVVGVDDDRGEGMTTDLPAGGEGRVIVSRGADTARRATAPGDPREGPSSGTMTSMTWHETLRAQLVDALRAVDPDAPTLCEGWQARHLAAHVVLRESSVTVGAGLAVPALAGAAERAIDSLAQTATTPEGYAELVDRVAAGPSRWHPIALAGDAANVVEFYVHAEDVRRGAGPAPERDLDPDLVEVLWRGVLRFARARTLRLPVGLVLVRADGPRAHVTGAKGDHGTVVVRGGAGELVLWLSGRGEATSVVAQGSPDDLAVLEQRFPLP